MGRLQDTPVHTNTIIKTNRLRRWQLQRREEGDGAGTHQTQVKSQNARRKEVLRGKFSSSAEDRCAYLCSAAAGCVQCVRGRVGRECVCARGMLATRCVWRGGVGGPLPG